MISRLTTIATLFAVLGTASIAFAASNPQVFEAAPAAKPVRIVQLETVVIVGKRLNAAQR